MNNLINKEKNATMKIETLRYYDTMTIIKNSHGNYCV